MHRYSPFIILLGCFSVLSVVKAVEIGVVDFQLNREEIRLQVNQVSLPEVLNKISDKTDLLIHYSVLPAAPVIATCFGESIKPVLECLLGGTVDMVFRYSENLKDLSLRQPVEVWLLGSSLSIGAEALKECVQSDASSNQTQEKLKPSSDQQAISDLEETLQFRMKMLMSGNALQKSQAISFLAENVALDNEEFNKILDEALTDDDAEIRGQAISALVRRQGEVNSLPELQQALLDADVSVRMMALQQVNETTGLIQQALNDENDSIRQFAKIKLQTE